MPARRTMSFSVVTRRRLVGIGKLAAASRHRPRRRCMVGEAEGLGDRRVSLGQGGEELLADGRCRRRRGSGPSAIPSTRTGFSRARSVARPARAAARMSGSAASPSPITSSASARRSCGLERRAERTGGHRHAVADAHGGIDGDQSDRSMASAGFWKPSSMMMRSTPSSTSFARRRRGRATRPSAPRRQAAAPRRRHHRRCG